MTELINTIINRVVALPPDALPQVLNAISAIEAKRLPVIEL